jgi:hypothetical protein
MKGERIKVLEFTKLTLGHTEIIRAYFQFSRSKACDITVGGLFMWCDYFRNEYAVLNDTLIVKGNILYHNGITAFAPPIGKDMPGALAAVDEYCLACGIPVVYGSVTKNELPVLRERYGDVKASCNPDWSDYLYKASDLLFLAGRKYHGQRNHINYFKKNTPYSFEAMTGENIGEVIAFFMALTVKSNSSDLFIEEHYRTLKMLNQYEAYGLTGGLVRVNGAVAAFAVGEIRNNILFVHVEKADVRHRGIYQVINNEFTAHCMSQGIEFVNRGEDVGDEGLRTAKKSYHPCQMVDKYTVEVNRV